MNQDRVAATRATYDRVAVDYDRRTASLDPAFTAFRTAFAAAVEGPVVDLGRVSFHPRRTMDHWAGNQTSQIPILPSG